MNALTVLAEPCLPIAYVAELELASDFAKASKSKATLAAYGSDCQSAFKFDPVSASNFDPLGRRVLAVALAPSELVGVAEAGRARVVA
jgi:hypothetical protein